MYLIVSVVTVVPSPSTTTTVICLPALAVIAASVSAVTYNLSSETPTVKSAANAAEEAILGILLVYDEHRESVRRGKIELTAEDFFTSLGKRIFEKIMELQNSDGGFSINIMGEDFSADEMGRMQKMIGNREALSENGTQILKSNIDALKQAKAKSTDGARLEDVLRAKRERLSKNK